MKNTNVLKEGNKMDWKTEKNLGFLKGQSLDLAKHSMLQDNVPLTNKEELFKRAKEFYEFLKEKKFNDLQ